MKATALFNGRREAGAWIGARGLQYGDGVFRTCLVHESRVVDLDRQIVRLAQDAAALSLSQRTARACRAEAAALAAHCDRGVIKILLWRRAGGRGYRGGTSAAERLLIRSEPARANPADWTTGVRAFRSPLVLAQQPLLAGVKHLNRLEQVLASRYWPRGVSEALLCDASGRPIGGSRSNLFWVARGALYTPELGVCGVAGMMRQKVLELAQALGIGWRIGRWSWRNFMESDEAFLTNSLIGIWPLRRAETSSWRAPGAITAALMRALAHPPANAAMAR